MIFTLEQSEKQKTLSRVISHLRESLDIETIFKITVTEVRQLLNTDRVSVFRFYPELEWEGEFIYEDVSTEWISILNNKLHENCCTEEFAQLYQAGGIKAISDIYDDVVTDCHIKMWEKFQVRANIAVPLMKCKDLWGLLCIHQCSGVRQWEASEIEFVQLIAEHLGVALQQADYIEQMKLQSAQLAQAQAREKALEWQKTIARTIEKIRQSLDLESIFRTTTEELRKLLNSDRVSIYRFNPDWSGEFVFESVTPGWVTLMQEQLQRPELGDNISDCNLKELVEPTTDTYLQDTGGGRFSKGEVYRICNDIYNAGFNDCYIKVLESYEAKAYVIVAILYNHKIWGLLAVYQNTGTRDWQEDEIYLLTQVSSQLGVALKQAEYLQQMQKQAAEISKAAELQKALVNTVDKIRQSLDIDTIFKTTTQEVRRLLEVERVAIYRFYPDWSGEFVADSILDGWTPVVKPQPVTEPLLLQGTKAGKYARNEVFVPISQGDKLWGLLVAYQNSQPRYWQDEEINLLAQIGSQLGVGLQQAELLERTQLQKEEITQTLKELQATQSQLIQSEKMASLGQLVAGVAHEINNPISFIYGNIPYVTNHTEDLLNLVRLYQQNYPQITAEIQQQEASLDLDFIADDLPKILDSMKTGANRIRELVLSLRTFARLDEADKKPVDLHEGIDSTLLILQNRLQPQHNFPAIEVVKEYADLPPVFCYAAQMNQVFMNIINNAIWALEKSLLKGKLIDIPKIWICSEATNRNSILIRIADNGCGIPHGMESRIFEPFFTTKEPGEGTGLGLSVCYQIIVEKHGGKINCVSAPGKGCEFLIEIPI
ncbi:GAF domain-containing protein [Anabaena sp. UHCC 0451]|nr:GAF domain-containing protein [Anabaena sp. UHCC 0451]MEA5576345.1 GAF domain-containing protein [Anabaena sp. UHCC 0451]